MPLKLTGQIAIPTIDGAGMAPALGPLCGEEGLRFDEASSEERLLTEIGKRLRAYRLQRNMTQAHLAREAGVSARTIRNLESGSGTQLESLLRVLRILGLLSGLNELLPPPTPSPIELLERDGAPRMRASGTRNARDPEPWNWGDEE